MNLPAGKYWIGDPCYVLDESGPEFNWGDFCHHCFKDDGSGRANDGVQKHQEILFAWHGTAYGDGCYIDQLGNSYGVDAGMIGCVPYEVISPYMTDKELNRLGNIYQFKLPFDSEYTEKGGVIRFGHVEIATDPENDEEDEEMYG
tara:strand:- start:288 stop:722 length:435 start_codon:yes stop_codon:yes gene_type:complete